MTSHERRSQAARYVIEALSAYIADGGPEDTRVVEIALSDSGEDVTLTIDGEKVELGTF